MKKLLFFVLIMAFLPSMTRAEPRQQIKWLSTPEWSKVKLLEPRRQIDWMDIPELSELSLFKSRPQGDFGKRDGQWSKDHEYYNQMKGFQPYLENPRHVQIPQWEHEDWYLEDWFTQEKGIDMVKGFYKADIFRDQYQRKDRKGKALGVKKLVVGPGFYHLSGFDKRRVVTILDATYGITERDENGSFILEDWNSFRPIGYYDKTGLRLH